MDKRFVGYARVSCSQQNEDRQIIALTEYGVPPSAVFVDKVSGKDFDRKNYKRMLKKLKKKRCTCHKKHRQTRQELQRCYKAMAVYYAG